MKVLKLHSCLAPEIHNFISLRQLSGTDYQSQAQLLGYFDRFLVEKKLREPRLTRQITEDYQLTAYSGQSGHPIQSKPAG